MAVPLLLLQITTRVGAVTSSAAIGVGGLQSVVTDASVSTDPAVVTESIVRKAKFGGGVLK